MDENHYDVVEKHAALPYGNTTIPVVFHLRKQWVVITK